MGQLAIAFAIAFAFIGCMSSSCAAEFDYFLFVREWPGTFCDHSKCKMKPANESVWTIHGLWPQYNNNSWPQFCNPKYPFDESEIKDLLDEMDDEWPSLLLSDFWKHEWDRHGTCALDVFPHEHEYFAAALKLHREYDLEDALAAEGIVPHPVRRYRLSAVQDAFRKHLGSIPMVVCARGELNEVRMCVSKGLEPFDCPAPSRTCPLYVKLPPFPDRGLPLKKSSMPCTRSLHRVWNIVPAARACPVMVAAMLLASVAVLCAAVLLVVHRRAAAERREAICTYTRLLPEGHSKLPL